MTATEELDEYQRLREWVEAVREANYYEILGVLELADEAAIKEAFHEFARSFHPDAHVGAPPDVQAALRYVYRHGAEAYRVLMDPAARSRYDLAVARGHLRLGSEPSPASRPNAPVQSLEDICRTPAARLSARRADEHISAGQLQLAKKILYEALAHDGQDNAALEERIEALEVAIFAMGS